ncbi:FecR family protein [Pedobacter sp. MC2016-14]|uniref:FecR family protein n=1 Tax=Pedobacter sp. MC2016-14 TaxID=2897327 RepID=UPI001E4F31FE|nr:FecR family protein [Pedobacter sp. MC2016-14]MCD0487657.1 FecR family protein [Pedobacter sp. MC2016-14]
MISKERLEYLITACQNLEASAAEQEELDYWYASFELDQDFTAALNAAEKSAVEARLMKDLDSRIKKSVWKWNWQPYAAAAAVLMVLTAGLMMYKSNRSVAPAISKVKKYQNDVAPGKNRAFLTLADGTKIDLNDKNSGLLASQSGAKIIKKADGTIAYEHTADKNIVPAYNTISIPKGGQYHLILPDGSEVWMNAHSSLKYPSVFAGNKREVELMGEAYFQIAHDQNKPFSVRSSGQLVKVLGTHFNINSYPEQEPVKTTLLQGSISLQQSATGKSYLLKPGQQASLAATVAIKTVDTEAAIAWKEGLFIFENTDIKTLMRQLERWYDVDINYSGLPDKRFYGRISRDVPLSEVLDMLEATSNLKFQIAGRRVTAGYQ